jgi:DNA-binding CsgD family transcriptional regulator
MLQSTGEAPKREEQVLVLAAGGLTDKEIAVRLGISPDTVGTYWRRILAKFDASSRTEVVAKYMEQRNRAALENLEYVNECLKLVADHMIASSGLPDAILASLPDWVLLVDGDGKIVFSNRPVGQDAHVGDVVAAEGLDESLRLAVQGPVQDTWRSLDGQEYQVTLAPGTGAAAGHIVATARAFVAS